MGNHHVDITKTCPCVDNKAMVSAKIPNIWPVCFPLPRQHQKSKTIDIMPMVICKST